MRTGGRRLITICLMFAGILRHATGGGLPAAGGAFPDDQRLREQGFPYPLASLPAAKPDPNLVMIPIRVARIGSNETPPVSPLWKRRWAAAARLSGRSLAGRTTAMSRWSTRLLLVIVPSCSFNRAVGSRQRRSTPGRNGRGWNSFATPPESDFGWTIDFTHSYNGPSFASGNSGVDYAKYDYFPVYNVLKRKVMSGSRFRQPSGSRL